MLCNDIWLTYQLLSSICFKMEAARSVVFNRTSYPPLILAFCSSVHPYCPFTQIPMHMQRRSLLASTLDEYSRLLCSLFSPVSFLSGCHNQMVKSRNQRIFPDDSTWSSTLRSSQEVPGRRPCLFDRCYFCASLLKADLFNIMSVLRYYCFR